MGGTCAKLLVGKVSFSGHPRANAPQRQHRPVASGFRFPPYGKEKKSGAYVTAIMNTILHRIEATNVIHPNTFALAA